VYDSLKQKTIKSHADYKKTASQSEHNPSAQDGDHGSHIENRNMPISKSNLPYSPSTPTLKIDSIVQAVLRKIVRNQFQDGGY
jgi:hypothetical protein